MKDLIGKVMGSPGFSYAVQEERKGPHGVGDVSYFTGNLYFRLADAFKKEGYKLSHLGTSAYGSSVLEDADVRARREKHPFLGLSDGGMIFIPGSTGSMMGLIDGDGYPSGWRSDGDIDASYKYIDSDGMLKFYRTVEISGSDVMKLDDVTPDMIKSSPAIEIYRDFVSMKPEDFIAKHFAVKEF